ncbi:hypothetical protein PENTCL1PPCAC_21855 [Pristionchus entomophagus]|uniref:Uncharacterized protein n=1 Tax=Pristionchus entomophagus TaxID=358040 RepID=A0AAV5TYS4_9BILA|nr:hypothetical protein PENTCL1PPCAC_21855 [Pristionchus entomophagus]
MPEWKRPQSENFEDFQIMRKLSYPFSETIPLYTSSAILTALTDLERMARESLARFDLEYGLLYYWRATQIGMRFLNETNLTGTDETCRRIHEMIKLCLIESAKLYPALKGLYVHHITLRNKDYLIATRAIVKTLTNSRDLKYLLIDLRESSDEQVWYEPNENALTILNLPKTCFPSELTISNVLPSEDEHKLRRFTECDMVILMGEETDDDSLE